MEQAGYIDKSQFSKVENAINNCRREGILPVDFVAEEDARAFTGIEPFESDKDDEYVLKWMLSDVLEGHKYVQPNWWISEEYYIQVLVEKIDLKTIFAPVCRDFKIPIANAKGWSSILQRAEYCRRFKEAEDMGLKCVLLYCGDHDADGLRISDTIRKNLEQVSEISWSDGFTGYDPQDLIIDRFGLNYDFIVKNGYTWIDNLITGAGHDLASPKHPNHHLPYVQDYLKEIGERKCEANAVVTTPSKARKLMLDAILKYLGPDAPERFRQKNIDREKSYKELLDEKGVGEIINKIIEDDNE
ncbi:MAG: hypothetical protein ACRCU6_06035 [Fusobacteriaceae bacterium]